MVLKRVFYLLYYIKEADFKRLMRFNRFASDITGLSQLKIIFDSVVSVFKYNISILDYFCFRFFELSDQERNKWAGTGFMYEYQLKMNPKSSRWVLEDKLAFNNRFKSFVKREYYSLQSLMETPLSVDHITNNPSGKIVLKNSLGQAGKEIKVLSCKEIFGEGLIKTMADGHFNLAEEYIVQHPEMMKLSPSGLNTVRIVTQEVDGHIEFLAARLRISINSTVDNMAAGNAAAPLDLLTGKVSSPAVFSDITKKDITIHPVTGIDIMEFQVPFWTEILNMIKEASLMIPENRSIGWDVAITASGPLLIEGNHNWCKLLWQLPVKKGLKKELEKYL